MYNTFQQPYSIPRNYMAQLNSLQQQNNMQSGTVGGTAQRSTVAPIYTVNSMQDVQMAQPNYDGSPSFFYLPGENVIVVKAMDLSGLVKLRYFKEELVSGTVTTNSSEAQEVGNIANETTAAGNTSALIDARIAPIMAELEELKQILAQKQNKEEKHDGSHADAEPVQKRNGQSESTDVSSKSIF